MLINKINSLPKNLLEVIYLSKDLAPGVNSRVYLVGGFVRDLILNFKNFDLDMVVEGGGADFAKLLSDKLGAKLTVHQRFGTATFITRDKLKVDIATARKETYPFPAALPEVEFGLLKDDLGRRDFTINAMAISLNKNNFGELIDYFDGQEDIRNRKIRVLHQLSFVDDPTRILRAVRFQERYGFRLGSYTVELLKAAVSSKMLNEVQPHRLRDEIILLLKEPRPHLCISRLNELCGLDFMQKGISLNPKKKEFLNLLPKYIAWFKKNLPRKRLLDEWVIYLIGLLDGLSLKSSEDFLKRFAFSKGTALRVTSYKKQSDTIIKKLREHNIKASGVYKLLEPLSYEAIIAIMAKAKRKLVQERIEDFLKRYNGTRIHICGKDLSGLGVKSGPHFKELMNKVLYARIDGKLMTKQQELDFLKKHIK